MPKFNDIRADGFRFRGYERRGASVYEKWDSPETWARRRAQKLASARRRGADPEVRKARVAATLRSYHRRKAERPAHLLWMRAKTRAKARGMEFTITVEDVVIPVLCPALGIPLRVGEGACTDNSPENNATSGELVALANYVVGLQAASAT
jgi:hypothetical protein